MAKELKLNELIARRQSLSKFMEGLENDYEGKTKGSIFKQRYNTMLSRKEDLEKRIMNYGTESVVVWNFQITTSEEPNVYKDGIIRVLQNITEEEVRMMLLMKTDALDIIYLKPQDEKVKLGTPIFTN